MSLEEPGITIAGTEIVRTQIQELRGQSNGLGYSASLLSEPK